MKLPYRERLPVLGQGRRAPRIRQSGTRPRIWDQGNPWVVARAQQAYERTVAAWTEKPADVKAPARAEMARVPQITPCRASVRIDKADYSFDRRSSSAWADYTDALRKISPGAARKPRGPVPWCARDHQRSLQPGRAWPDALGRQHLRRDSTCDVQPILAAIDMISARGEGARLSVRAPS